MIAEHGVKTLFTAPTAFRAIRREDPTGARSASTTCPACRYLFLAGERLDPETYHWAGDQLGIPVIDHWWQTETGWPIAANLMGLEPMPTKPGSATCPCPATTCGCVDPAGAEVPPGVDGEIVIRLPLPPGMPADAVGRRRAVRRLLPVAAIPATTSPATAGTATPTATCT